MMRRFSLALCIATAALASASAAAADPTTTTIQRSTESQTALSCGSFDVIQSFEIQQITTVLPNSSQTSLHVNDAVTFTNSVSGSSLRGRVAMTFQFSPGSATEQGLFLRITAPSVGADVLEAGVVKIVDNQLVFAAGPFDSSIDLCAALS